MWNDGDEEIYVARTKMKVESKQIIIRERLVTDRNLVLLGNLPPKYISPVDKPLFPISPSVWDLGLDISAAIGTSNQR